jgi:hypothetical protein
MTSAVGAPRSPRVLVLTAVMGNVPITPAKPRVLTAAMGTYATAQSAPPVSSGLMSTRRSLRCCAGLGRIAERVRVVGKIIIG